MQILFTSKKTLRKSGLLVSLILIILFFFVPFLFHGDIKIIPVIFAILISMLSIISPYTLRVPYTLWVKLGILLGKINSILILSFFFYMIISPVALLRRFFKIFSSNAKINTYKEKSLLTKEPINFKDQY